MVRCLTVLTVTAFASFEFTGFCFCQVLALKADREKMQAKLSQLEQGGGGGGSADEDKLKDFEKLKKMVRACPGVRRPLTNSHVRSSHSRPIGKSCRRR